MRLEIQCEDRVGMAREVLDLFVPYAIDMKGIEVDSLQRRMYCAFPDIPFSELQTLLAEIRRIEGVEDVKTVMFTPSEREHNALYTLLKALPDGVISIDLRGNVMMATQTALDDLKVCNEDMIGQPLSRFIKGVNFHKHVSDTEAQWQSKRVKVSGQTYLMEMWPIFVPDQDGESIRAGSVINLKSEKRLNSQTASLMQPRQNKMDLSQFVVNSLAMKQCVQRAEAFAELDMPLLIHGECGVGKMALVTAMFEARHGGQEEYQLRCVKGQELTLTALESMRTQKGWLVIESLAKVPEDVQEKLVDWGTPTDGIRWRLLTLSECSPDQLRNVPLVNKKLFYQLTQLTLEMPSLANRKEDLPMLAERYVEEAARQLKKAVPTMNKGALAKLSFYHWPGNLNELRNLCLQALVVCEAGIIRADDFAIEQGDPEATKMELREGSLDRTVKYWEAKLLKELYPKFPSSRLLAKEVGLSHSAVANKLKEYGIRIPKNNGN